MNRPIHYLVSSLAAIGIACAVPLAGAQEPAAETKAVPVAQDVAIGWSVKKSLLGKSIYNEKEEELGVINDLLIAPDSTVSHVVISTAPKSGEASQELAIDAASLQVHDGKFYVQVGAADSGSGGKGVESVKAAPRIDLARFL
jgi:hypothetical protein